MTVVQKYPHVSKDGTKSTYLRHLAFDGRFRYLDGEWFLEIAPTYRFTTDGMKKSWLHEYRLSGIKRIEGNRAVLSQVLAWSSVLSAEPGSNRPKRHLRFGPLPVFQIDRPIPDEELTSIDALDGTSAAPPDAPTAEEPVLEEAEEG
jgi:hypothetical protein